MRQFFPTAVCNVTAWSHWRLRAHWLMALVGVRGGGYGRIMYSAFPRNCSVSYLSFVYGKSLWVELNGEGNSLYTGRQTCSLYLVLWLCAFRFPLLLNIQGKLWHRSNQWYRLLEGWKKSLACSYIQKGTS